MKANARRAEQIAEGSADRPNLVRDIAFALDAAERRGEERVLREMRRGVCDCNGDERTPHATRGISCAERAIKTIRARRARKGGRG